MLHPTNGHEALAHHIYLLPSKKTKDISPTTSALHRYILHRQPDRIPVLRSIPYTEKPRSIQVNVVFVDCDLKPAEWFKLIP
jgi:hypothetical protein